MPKTPPTAPEAPAPQVRLSTPAAPQGAATPREVLVSARDSLLQVPTPTQPQTAPQVPEAAEISARLKEELEAASRAREALEAREARAASRERLGYLRKMGAIGSLSDENLLALAPEADPGTQDGRETLHAWTEANGGLFKQRSPTGAEVQASVIERLPSSQGGTFGAALHQSVIDSVFGSGSKR